MRQESRGRHGGVAADGLFPLEVRRRRRERGLSRDELARLTGYSRHYLSQLEQPSRGIAARPVVAAVDAALDAGGALIDLREAAVAARADRLARGRDPEQESRRRMQNLLDHGKSDHELDLLDSLVAGLIATADRLAPADVTALVLDQQRQVDALLRTPMLPHQQFRLYMLAGHLAGLLAISLLDMNELAKASTCCLEAAVFTELTGHEGLRAWTLAVNGLIDAAARKAGDEAKPAGEIPVANPGGTPAAETDAKPTTPRTNQLTPITYAGPVDFAGGAQPVGPGLDDALIAPGGRATPPKLVAMVKGRIARFATAAAQRAHPPAGLSHAFRPPI
jgi:transcriptional regulator with XRE-family HTH domain